MDKVSVTREGPDHMPPIVKPMTATAADVLPIGPAWSYEVKWDGYRTLAVKDGARVTLLSRNGFARHERLAAGVSPQPD